MCEKLWTVLILHMVNITNGPSIFRRGLVYVSPWQCLVPRGLSSASRRTWRRRGKFRMRIGRDAGPRSAWLRRDRNPRAPPGPRSCDLQAARICYHARTQSGRTKRRTKKRATSKKTNDRTSNAHVEQRKKKKHNKEDNLKFSCVYKLNSQHRFVQ